MRFEIDKERDRFVKMDEKFVESVKWVVSRPDCNIDILPGHTGCEIKIGYRYADWFANVFFSVYSLRLDGRDI
jgi:hypothetical protein